MVVRSRPHRRDLGIRLRGAWSTARVRTEPKLVVAFVAIVVVAATAVALIPRSLERLGDGSLRTTLDTTVVSQSSLRVESLATLPSDPHRALEQLREQGQAELSAADPALRAILEPPQLVVDLPRMALSSLTGDDPADANDRLLTIRIQEGLDDHVAVVDGRLPEGDARRAGPGEDDGDDGSAVALVEVALSQETAATLDVAVGDRLKARPDAEDAIARRVPTSTIGELMVEVVGLVELSDPGDDVWFNDPRLHRPGRRDGAGTTFFAFGLLPPAAVGGMPDLGREVPVLVNWRFRVDPAAITANVAGDIRDAVRRLEAAGTTNVGSATLATDLGALLDREQTRRDEATATLLHAAMAVAVLALLLVTMTVRVGLSAARRATALKRSRGASPGQLVTAQVVGASVATLTAGTLGWLVAWLLMPGASGWAAAAPVALLMGVTLAMIATASVVEARQPLPHLFRDPEGVRPGGRLMRLLETVIVAAAGASVTVAVAGAEGEAGDLSHGVLAAAAPALTAVGTGLLAARAYRRPLRRVGRLAARSRGVHLPLGLARAVRDRTLGSAVGALLIGVAIAVGTAAVPASLTASQQQVAWDQIGVPTRIVAPPGEVLDPRLLDAVSADATVASGHRLRTSVLDEARSRGVEVLVTDPAALAQVASGTPAAFELPQALTDASLQLADGTIPAVAARSGFVRDSTEVGDRLTVLVGSQRVEVEVVAVHDRLPAVTAAEDAWLLLPERHIARMFDSELAPTELAIAARPDLIDLETVARTSDTPVQILSPDRIVEELRIQPLARAIEVAYRATSWLAVVAAIGALLAVLLLTRRARERDLTILAALGASRHRTRVVLTELLPPLTATLLAGLAVGLGLTSLLDTQLNLAPFAADRAVQIRPSVGATLRPVAIAAVATVVLAVLAAIPTARTSTPDILDGSHRT